MAESAVDIFASTTVDSHTPFNLEKLTDQFRHRKTDWSIPQAYLCILLAAAYADGAVSAEEEEEIKALAMRSRALKSLSPNELAEANRVVIDRLQTRQNGLQEACETLPTDMCLPVFAHCADLVLADGDLLKPESEFLQNLVSLLGIQPDNARRVMEVLLLKNQY